MGSGWLFISDYHMKKTDKTKTKVAKPKSAEAKRFADFVRQVVSVPKEEIDKREAEYQKNKAKKSAGV